MVRKKSNQRITKIKYDAILDLINKAEKIPVENAVTINPAGANLIPYPDLNKIRFWIRDNLLKGINGIFISGYKLRARNTDTDFLTNPAYLKFTTILDGLVLNTQECKICNLGSTQPEQAVGKPGLQLSNLLCMLNGTFKDSNNNDIPINVLAPIYRPDDEFEGDYLQRYRKFLEIKNITGNLIPTFMINGNILGVRGPDTVNTISFQYGYTKDNIIYNNVDTDMSPEYPYYKNNTSDDLKDWWDYYKTLGSLNQNFIIFPWAVNVSNWWYSFCNETLLGFNRPTSTSPPTWFTKNGTAIGNEFYMMI